MESRELIAYMMEEMDGEIHGRVQLQKLAYFCKTYGVSVDASYKLYIYGPYSQQVSDALQEGVMDDIFHESKGSIAKGEAFDRYTDCIWHDHPLSMQQKKTIHEVLNTFKGMPNEQLEILATTFFIYRQQKSLFGDADKNSVLDKVRRAKASRFTEEQIISSYSKMEEICFPLAEKYA